MAAKKLLETANLNPASPKKCVSIRMVNLFLMIPVATAATTNVKTKNSYIKEIQRKIAHG